jgi:hypothetical protein
LQSTRCNSTIRRHDAMSRRLVSIHKWIDDTTLCFQRDWLRRPENWPRGNAPPTNLFQVVAEAGRRLLGNCRSLLRRYGQSATSPTTISQDVENRLLRVH